MCVLDYPTVLVSERDIKEFTEALEKELKRYSIAVRKVRRPDCRGFWSLQTELFQKGTTSVQEPYT